MNATKFVVLLLIGVLCANVGARKVEEVSKDTKLSTPLPKSSTKGIGAELNVVIDQTTTDQSYSSSYVSRGTRGPTATGTGSTYINTRGTVKATGRNTAASVGSGVGTTATSRASTRGNSANAAGASNGGGNVIVRGRSRRRN